MNHVQITRIKTGDQGTFGALVADTGFHCFTGELPWLDNKTGISCIPSGIYTARYSFSRHFQRMLYRLDEVPERVGVLIHSGNFCGDRTKSYKSHSRGCILLGRAFGALNGQQAVLGSMPTLLGFVEEMERKPFTLEIKNGD